ncbi:MAG: PKD domain-containing protein, partial [Pirellulales bacterium]
MQIKASGDLNAGGLDLNGVFDLSLGSSSLDVYATGHIDVGSLATLGFTSDLTISSDGVYGDLMLDAQTLSGTAFTICGTTDIQINTTDAPQNGLAADTVQVHVAGSAQLQKSYFGSFADSFDVQGTFDLTVNPNYVHVVAIGNVALGPLGTVAVSGDWSATSAGLWGDLTVGATALPYTSGFSMSGEMQLEVNTTGVSQTVLARPIDPTSGAVGAPQNITLAPDTVDVAIGGHVSLLNTFTLAGELDVTTYSDGELDVNFDANVSVFNVTLTVTGSVGIRSDASVYGTLTVTAGGSDDLSFSAGGFTISAQADFTFDTETETAHFSLHGANGGPATVSFLGISASGYLTIDYSSSVFTISVPDISISVPDLFERGGAAVWNQLFGSNGPFDPNASLSFDASGFFSSDGQFELTFSGSDDLGDQPFETGLGATGGFTATIGNFTGWVPTSYSLPYSGNWNGNQTYTPILNYQYASFTGFSAQVWGVGWLQDVGYGLMTGGVTISQGYFNANFWAAAHFGNLWTAHEDWGWWPGINFNVNIGSLGSASAPAPVIDAFSPSGEFGPGGTPLDSTFQGRPVYPYVTAHVPGPTFVYAGTTPVLHPVSYSEKIYYNGNLISTGPSFFASVPGVYQVVVTATDASQGGLSTSQTGYLLVKDAPPSNASFNIVSTAALGQSVTTSNVTYDNWAGNSEHDAWTVTQHGTLVAAGTGPNFTFRPEITGDYVVTAVVSDDYGGSTQVSRTLTVVNAGAGLTFFNNGPVNEGSPVSVGFNGGDPTAGLTYSFDFQDDGSFTDPGDVANSSSPTASYTFTQPGTYTIHGRAGVQGGASTDYYTTVTIADPAVVVVGDNIQGTEGS